MLKPRKHVVFFRVSDDEFERMNELCRARGVRSLSDLARAAIDAMLQHSNESSPHQLVPQMQRLENTMLELSEHLERIAPRGQTQVAPPHQGEDV